MNISDAFSAHARNHPDRAAVEDGERIVTYAELEALATCAAVNLRNEGIVPGDTVGLALPDSIEQIALLWALARFGAVIFPIHAQLLRSKDEVGLDRHQLRVVIVAHATPSLPSGSNTIPLTALFRNSPEAPSQAAAPGGQDPLYCAQSSGTTGTPKTFLMSHNQVIGSFQSDEEFLRWTAADRYIALIGPSFPVGCRLCFAALFAGATVIINRTTYVEELVRLIRNKRVTVASLTPVHPRPILNFAAGKEPLFPLMRSLRVVTAGVTAGERHLARRHVTPNVVIVYCCNEQSWIAAATPADQDAEPDSVGRPVAGVQVEIVDEDNQALPFGAVGRLRVRSDHIATGYLNNPEADARAFQGGWFYPMDLAAINHDGYIILKGRADDLISADGIKFYPIEVETVLLTHPAVREAAVFGWPHPMHGQIAVAAVTTSAQVTDKDIKAFCRQHLALYKVPQLIMRLAELQRNEMGKIIKEPLKEKFRQKIAERPEEF